MWSFNLYKRSIINLILFLIFSAIYYSTFFALLANNKKAKVTRMSELRTATAINNDGWNAKNERVYTMPTFAGDTLDGFTSFIAFFKLNSLSSRLPVPL